MVPVTIVSQKGEILLKTNMMVPPRTGEVLHIVSSGSSGSDFAVIGIIHGIHAASGDNNNCIHMISAVVVPAPDQIKRGS